MGMVEGLHLMLVTARFSVSLNQGTQRTTLCCTSLECVFVKFVRLLLLWKTKERFMGISSYVSSWVTVSIIVCTVTFFEYSCLGKHASARSVHFNTNKQYLYTLKCSINNLHAQEQKSGISHITKHFFCGFNKSHCILWVQLKKLVCLLRVPFFFVLDGQETAGKSFPTTSFSYPFSFFLNFEPVPLRLDMLVQHLRINWLVRSLGSGHLGQGCRVHIL